MSKRLSRSDWLHFGLAELASNGPEALRVKRLCAAAGKTIGSFYHHFDDQAAFIDALMEHWHKTFTQPVIDALEEIDDAKQRARELSDRATEIDPSIEVGVRLLASQNARVRQAVERVDRQRIDYVMQMYAKRFGITADEAHLVAQLEYAAFVGAQHTFNDSYTTVGPKLAGLLQSALEAKYRS